MKRLPDLFFAGLIMMYRCLVSPALGRNCRFYPSCSHYALIAVRKHGSRRALPMIFRRVLCCHPFNEGGVDFPPGCCSSDKMSDCLFDRRSSSGN